MQRSGFQCNFFDTSPASRILNSFSSDIDYMDERLPVDLHDVLQGLTFTVIAIILEVS